MLPWATRARETLVQLQLLLGFVHLYGELCLALGSDSCKPCAPLRFTTLRSGDPCQASGRPRAPLWSLVPASQIPLADWLDSEVVGVNPSPARTQIEVFFVFG